ncbi:MAG: uracil-DNA glycosylase [Luteolibacter sp.]
MIRPVDVLLEFLEAEQARGVSHVHLDQGARDGLRQLFNQARPGAKTAAPELPARVEMPVETPLPPAVSVSMDLKIEGKSREDKLAGLRHQAENWAPARALGTLRETMVFSTGSPEARVMLIGEAPGYQDEKERQPFAGPAGQKLNDILKAMGLSREDVYLANIVKFRPSTPKQTTNNRRPTPAEMTACMPFLRAEIAVIQPQCVIALGETTAEGLLGLSGHISTMRGSWHDFEGTPVRVTYHLSHLLQTSGGNQTKRLLWEDMLSVMEKIDLPISAKQRGFFLPKP